MQRTNFQKGPRQCLRHTSYAWGEEVGLKKLICIVCESNQGSKQSSVVSPWPRKPANKGQLFWTCIDNFKDEEEKLVHALCKYFLMIWSSVISQ